jgi:dCTP diphosphatase
MDVKILQQRLAKFAEERHWELVHNPKNLAMALAAEAGALLELFKWLTEEQSRKIAAADTKEVAADVIAAIMLHALRFADKAGIDLDEAVARKLTKLEEKYPARDTTPVMQEPAPVVSEPASVVPEPASVVSEPASVVSEPASVVPEPEPQPEPAPVVRAPAPRPEPAVRRASAPVSAKSAAPRAARPTARASPPSPRPVPAPPPVTEKPTEPEPLDRYGNLDPEAARELLQSLSHRIKRAPSADPLLRELQEELDTLKRTLYSAESKRVWIADSLKTIRRMLEEAADLSVGDHIRAKEHIAQIERVLEA